MYGKLNYDPDDADGPWTVTCFLTRDLTPPVVSVERAAVLGKALGQIKTEVPGLTPAQINGLKAVALALPVDRVDLVSDLYLALAHMRLPDAQRREREARIDRTLDAHFHGTPPLPDVLAGINHLKLLAPMTPDAFLESMLRSHAARLQLAHLVQPAWARHFADIVRRLDMQIGPAGIQLQTPEDRRIQDTCFTRPLAERAAFIDLMTQAGRRRLIGAVCLALDSSAHPALLVEAESDMLVGAFQDCLAAGLDGSMQAEVKAVVANQVELAIATDLARARAAIEATIDAVHAGVPMGERVKQQNELAINTANRVGYAQLLLMTPQRLRLRSKLFQPQAPQPHPGDDAPAPPDLDPVSAWSVSRLLQWIGGPIADKAPQRLDRRAMVAQENKARQEARARTQVPETGPRSELDLDEAEVEWAVQDALVTTAGFFIGDIEDMLFRGKALGLASAALPACADLLAPLQRVRQGEVHDDQAVRALLHRAEEAIDRLRGDIHARDADARTRQRFAMQLQAALAREPMVQGKRHGGVIDCPLHRDDWPWVAGQYHRRWLPWARKIVVDGVAQTLPPDQALGLYVTGKSLSGYGFDVSVHLWQRRPQRHGAPGVGNAPFSPMNTEDWIDTLTPCLVLHVPLAT